jgi:hypothetical protein
LFESGIWGWDDGSILIGVNPLLITDTDTASLEQLGFTLPIRNDLIFWNQETAPEPDVLLAIQHLYKETDTER